LIGRNFFNGRRIDYALRQSADKQHCNDLERANCTARRLDEVERFVVALAYRTDAVRNSRFESFIYCKLTWAKFFEIIFENLPLMEELTRRAQKAKKKRRSVLIP
jgi:hypothetical protein